MSYETKCSRCGGTDLEPGSVQSTGKLYFRPANSKFMTFRTADIAVHANACVTCGNIEWMADVKKLAALTERVKPY